MDMKQRVAVGERILASIDFELEEIRVRQLVARDPAEAEEMAEKGGASDVLRFFVDGELPSAGWLRDIVDELVEHAAGMDIDEASVGVVERDGAHVVFVVGPDGCRFTMAPGPARQFAALVQASADAADAADKRGHVEMTSH